jgi:DNA/RNA-binding domain of Phe-tRNA-synthetase-like protein
MIYRTDSQLFQKYPGYVRGLVIVRRAINIESPIDEIQRMLRSTQETIRQRSDLETPAMQPNIAAWREAFRAFGARQAAHRGDAAATDMGKPSEYPSSIEALVKRVRRGDALTSLSAGLPYINTLAAICNNASLRYLVPIGGHAIDAMQADGDLRLGFAIGNEDFAPLGGAPQSGRIEHPIPGEVIFTYNASTVLCRRWTWRQSEFSKLQRTTTAAVINVDGLPPVTRADVELICNDLATLVGMYCGNAPTEVKLLSEEQIEVEL